MSKNTRALLRASSSVSANLAAAWFAVAFITPNFTDLKNPDAIFFLTKNILLAIVFLGITALLERALANE